MPAKKYQVTLGCGLIGIGRPWGFVATQVPTEAEAFSFLEHAFRLGIRYFDTAPSYARSEARLGSFLRGLTREQRKEVVVATKFGESWDETAQDVVVDHSLDALTRSLDQSLNLLGHNQCLADSQDDARGAAQSGDCESMGIRRNRKRTAVRRQHKRCRVSTDRL